MKKYLKIFDISIAQEFVYSATFIIWRIQNIIQILIFFFFWDATLSGKTSQVFGYDKTRIFTYAFTLIIVRALVFSSKSSDVSSDIASGDIVNLLLKPINYFRYWITRDVSNKILNVIFGIVEASVLILLLKPPVFLQTNFFFLISFIFSILIAMFLFFCILMVTNFVSFWAPEISWSAQFLVIIVIAEFLSGSYFPLDVFPSFIYQILRFTPFPYLIFVPIKIYLGSFGISMVLQSLGIGLVWCFVLKKLMDYVWKKGLSVYEAVGR